MINKQSTTTGCGLIISSDFSVVILPHRIKIFSPDAGSCVNIGFIAPIQKQYIIATYNTFLL